MESLEISTESLHLSKKFPAFFNKDSQNKRFEFSAEKPKSFHGNIETNNLENQKLKVNYGALFRRASQIEHRKSLRLLKTINFAFKTDQKTIEIEKKQDNFLMSKGILVAAKLIAKFRKNKFYKDLANLSESQIKMIGDKSGAVKEFPNLFSKLFFSKNSVRNLENNILNNLLQIIKIYFFKDKLGRLSAYLRNKIPVCDANNPFKIMWDLALMSMTLARIVIYSIEKAFLINLDIEALGFNLIILLFLNIVIILNTNYYYEGAQVIDRKKIFRNFIRNHIVNEVIPCISLSFTYFSRDNLFIPVHDINIVLVLRLVNAGELGARIKSLLIKNDKTESLYNLVILVFKILLWGHLIACIWHFVAIKSTEINPEGINWLKSKDIAGKEWKTRYLYSIYWAVTTMLTVGYGDITPANESEMMFNILAMLLGCGMFGYTMNSIGEILKFSGRNERNLKDHMKLVNNMMEDKNLPSDTQIKIRKYMEFVWKQEHKKNPEQEKLIMNKLTSKLRDEIYMNTTVQLLKSVPAMKHFSNKTLLSLSSFMKKVRFSPEEHVYKEGDYEDLSLYFVIEGTLELVKERDGIKCKSISAWTTYKKDNYFGVNEFFTGKSRSLAVVSVDYSTLFKLNRNDILHVLQKNQLEMEQFSYIKDLELLYGKQEQYEINCTFCKKMDHILKDCRFFSYKPLRQIVIGKHLYRRKKFLKNFKRKLKIKSKALLCKTNLLDSVNDFLTVYHDDEHLNGLINYYETLFNNENERSVKDFDSQLKSNEGYDNENEMEEEGEEEEDDSKNSDEDPGKQTEQSFSQNHIKTQKSYPSWKNLSILVPKSQMQRGRSFGKDPLVDFKPDKKDILKENTPSKFDGNLSSCLPKDRDMIKSRSDPLQVHFDRVKHYKFYFPRNNLISVVSKYNKKIFLKKKKSSKLLDKN